MVYAETGKLAYSDDLKEPDITCNHRSNIAFRVLLSPKDYILQ